MTVCPKASGHVLSHAMTKFHVLAAAGDSADELRSLGLYDATTAHDALAHCLAHLDDDPVADHEAAPRS